MAATFPWTRCHPLSGGFALASQYGGTNTLQKRLSEIHAYSIPSRYGGRLFWVISKKIEPNSDSRSVLWHSPAIGKVGAFFPTDDRRIVNERLHEATAILSTIVTFYFVHPVDTAEMVLEDHKFWEYLEAHGYDSSAMGLPGASMTENSSVDDSEANEKKIDEEANPV
ncbi:hypothetical protein GALMADRAFT_216851 [Galerina marginata CBS 339.88]|uniref:Uncharacterized protein n=1 Tax=Galerina marginata (strain CBS 339.88) TaxID=685588 RepID=A0A067S7I1_GALM3|nr:hypothetical protein GALMADRAFT_216851 [Galerina marginata CBS 339.88]